MVDVSVARLKRTRMAQTFKRVVLRRPTPPPPPLVSVVVPFHNAEHDLRRCLDSLQRQTHGNLQVILVNDGSTDRSREIAQEYVAGNDNIIVVDQEHLGVGAARNSGARLAHGEYLAFCDADDSVMPGGYGRLVTALEASGSDLAIGSVALQTQGRYVEPKWARRSNRQRHLAARVEDVPEIMANLMPGTRLFRRSFWEEQGLSFPDNRDHNDALPMVQAMLRARGFDVIPAVVYRWTWREDGRSLLQRDLRDSRRVADRVAGLCEAGELLTKLAPEPVQQQFFAEILHTTIPDFVRAAVCRDDGYWEALAGQLRRLMDMVSDKTLRSVAVEDRMVAWLCAHDERPATEAFLEYAFDNQYGYPYRLIDGRAHIALPFIDALRDVSPELTSVADTDMRYRTRLVALRWKRPLVLEIEGSAFIEYTDDSHGPSTVTLVLKERATGQQIEVPTRPAPEIDVNQWAARAQEDHTGAGFAAEIDVSTLPRPTDAGAVYEVAVHLEIAGLRRAGIFQLRVSGGSAGLLERSSGDGLDARPVWKEFAGLSVHLRPARDDDHLPLPPAVPVHVSEVAAEDGLVRLTGTSAEAVQLRMQGPRAATDWVTPDRVGDRFVARLPATVDEWGLGVTSLPADKYTVLARADDGQTVTVALDPELRRSLPTHVVSGSLQLVPSAGKDDELVIRLSPVEWRCSRPPFLRRQLRDEAYPAAREKPLLDVVLFETFAGKAAGDNPGALAEALARRDSGLELVFSVYERSIVVPDGVREVVRWSPEWFELLGRARYLIVNAALPYFFRKRPGQMYFQTWHGTPLKRIAHDRPHLDFFNWHHRRQLLVARDGWDYLLSQSDFCSRSLRSAFRYDGKVLELGYPRNDLLRSHQAEEVRRATRRRLGLQDHQKVVLYAPTWRDNSRVGRVFNKVLYLEPGSVVDQVENAVVLVRGHYNSVGAAEDQDPNRRVIDVTRYPDISHLYLAADALVTDYSSVFFDFVITDKPMVFLAPDLVEYRDDNRGFYLDYHETVPGPICLSTQEVVNALNGPDRFGEVREKFRRTYTPLDDGRSADRVLDAILGSDTGG